MKQYAITTKICKNGVFYMYGQDETKREQLIEEYKPEVVKLLRYLPYFTKKTQKDVSSMYTGDGDHKVIPIPVYDTTLLQFVKEYEKSVFCNKNYHYIYSRNHIKTHDDELRFIKNAKVTETDFKIIGGIMSKYVLGGKTKAALWSEGVGAGIYEACLMKLNEMIFKNSADGSKMIQV